MCACSRVVVVVAAVVVGTGHEEEEGALRMESGRSTAVREHQIGR